MNAEAMTTPAAPCRIADYLELTKPRITAMIGVSTAAGFLLTATGASSPWLMAHALLGTMLVGCGASTLNQVLEWRRDACMERTANRPLPAGRLEVAQAALFGSVLAVFGTAELISFVNPLTAALGALSFVLYVFVYTPLKPRTSFATFVGAIPGALPPVMGSAAAAAEVPPLAWVLFLLVFLWQLPHSLAIAWLYRHDFARGGYRLLTFGDTVGRRTSMQMVLYAAALLPVSLLPTILGLSGLTYLIGALVAGLGLLACTIGFGFSRGRVAARRVLFASLAYLPAVLLLLVVDPG